MARTPRQIGPNYLAPAGEHEGANIGLGWIMMIAPIPISIAVIVAASRSEWKKG